MFNCDHCPLVFGTPWDLNIHVRLCHVESSLWPSNSGPVEHNKNYPTGITIPETSQGAPIQRDFHMHFRESVHNEGKGYYGMFPEHFREAAIFNETRMKDDTYLPVHSYGQPNSKLPSVWTSSINGTLNTQTFQSHGNVTKSSLLYDFPTTVNSTGYQSTSDEYYRGLSQNGGIDTSSSEPSVGCHMIKSENSEYRTETDHINTSQTVMDKTFKETKLEVPNHNDNYNTRPVGLDHYSHHSIDGRDKTNSSKYSGSHERTAIDVDNYPSRIREDLTNVEPSGRSMISDKYQPPVGRYDQYTNQFHTQSIKMNAENHPSYLNESVKDKVYAERFDSYIYQSRDTIYTGNFEASANDINHINSNNITTGCFQNGVIKSEINQMDNLYGEDISNQQVICKKESSEEQTLKNSEVKVHRQPGKGRGRKPAVEKVYQCRFCGVQFSQKEDLASHVRVHVDEFTHRCIMCSEAFENNSGLRKHKQIHRSANSDHLFECILCRAELKTWSRVEVHMRFHTGERPFKCDVCGADFAARYGLKKHERIHSGDKPFKCDWCPLKFTDKCNLENHVRTHTGEKPFDCEICGKKFALKNSLKVHLMMHKGESPFKCEVCAKIFYRKQHLTTHRRIHTGERPYKCLICEKAFSRNHHLTVHIRQHTGEKPFKCTECDKRFPRKNHLGVHMKHHTGETTLPKRKVSLKLRKKSKKTKSSKSGKIRKQRRIRGNVFLRERRARACKKEILYESEVNTEDNSNEGTEDTDVEMKTVIKKEQTEENQQSCKEETEYAIA